VDEGRAVSEPGGVERLPGSDTVHLIMPPIWAEEHTTICYHLQKLQHLLSRRVASATSSEVEPSSGPSVRSRCWHQL